MDNPPLQPVEVTLSSNIIHPAPAIVLQDTCNQTDMSLFTETEMPHFENGCKQVVETTATPKWQGRCTIHASPGPLKDSKEVTLKKESKDSLKIEISSVPVVNIKKEVVSPSQVDISGLELLSNSIDEFMGRSEKELNNKTIIGSEVVTDSRKKDLSNDECEGAVLLQNLRNGFRESEKTEVYESASSENLGGLGLLCALAEQRFQEEVGMSSDKSKRNEVVGNERGIVKEDLEVNVISESFQKEESNKCDLNRNYQSKHNLPVIKKESKSSCKNDSEKVESVQPLEKISENHILKVKGKEEESKTTNELINPFGKKGPGRPKKIKNVKTGPTSRSELRECKEMSPPVLEKMTTDFPKQEERESPCLKQQSKDVLKPPTLTPSAVIVPSKATAEAVRVPPCEIDLVTLKIEQDYSKKSKLEKSDLYFLEDSKKRKQLDLGLHHSSSKKRKVGRPKKHFLVSGNKRPLTETIVAKKIKTKSSSLLSSMQGNESTKAEVPVEISISREENIKTSSLELDDVKERCDLEDSCKKSKKIRPKLKAEATVREWTPIDEESVDWKKSFIKKEISCQKLKPQKKVFVESKKINGCNGVKAKPKSNLQSCVLTAEHLNNEKGPLRTLTAMGGLFYAGQLSAITAPDVYGVTIDGERGNRPHIYSREEILKDSVGRFFLLPIITCQYK